MWEELANVGVKPLKTAEDVDAVLAKDNGTVLCVVNSVCGCAAGNARPGVSLSLQNDTIPDELVTVFAGMDTEAVAQARGYMAQVPPSSPCIAVFKEGKPAFVLERRHIERMTAVQIANALAEAYNEHCSAKGPSVPREVFEQNVHADICGSSLAPYEGN
jgi:putative YphP/YqiW family bacilliredoxin